MNSKKCCFSLAPRAGIAKAAPAANDVEKNRGFLPPKATIFHCGCPVDQLTGLRLPNLSGAMVSFRLGNYRFGVKLPVALLSQKKKLGSFFNYPHGPDQANHNFLFVHPDL